MAKSITIRVTSFALIASILFSCAASYKTIGPQNLTYGSKTEGEGISYSYQHGVLAGAGNKRYANREMKNPVKLVAIEFTNNTDRVINFRKDVDIFMGDRQVLPTEPSVVHHQLKQRAGLYMLWSLVWLTYSKCETPDGDCSVMPIPVGVLIGIGNTSAASNANKKFLAELNANNILDRKINPGETVKGLIGITSDTTGSISLKLN